MKIVDFDTFVLLPEDTVYSVLYDRCIDFDGLYVKHESSSVTDSFICADLINTLVVPEGVEYLSGAEEVVFNGKEGKIDFECTQREYRDPDVRFAIWSEDDIMGLINKLSTCLLTLKAVKKN